MVLWWASLSLISEFGGLALVIVGFGSFASQDLLVVFGLAWLWVCCGVMVVVLWVPGTLLKAVLDCGRFVWWTILCFGGLVISGFG